MKTSWRMLVLQVLRRLLRDRSDESDEELLRQLDDAIEQEQSEQEE